MSLVGSAVLAQPQPVGAEFQVNTHTVNEQLDSSTAMDSDGNFVVVWISFNQDGQNFGVFAQRLDSSGAEQGTEFQVNSHTLSYQTRPTAAMDGDGDFVVAWSSNGQDGAGTGIFARRFASSGAALGAEFLVNSYTPASQDFSSIAIEDNGDFVVAWQSPQDGSSEGVFAQRFSSAGGTLGGEFQVNTYTFGSQADPSVARDGDGDFVVAWSDQYQDDSFLGVFAQRFDALGAALGSEFQVNTYTTNSQLGPSVAMSDSGFVVAWESYQDGSATGVFARRFDSSGAAQGGEFQANTYTVYGQAYAAAAMDDEGDFVIVWSSYYQDGSSYRGIFGQPFDSAGVAQSAELQVNTHTDDDQRLPSAAMDADGDFVVAWESAYQDGDGFGVFAQRFAGPADGPIPVTIDIKPGMFPNKVNIKSNGLVQVAILTTSVADGDAADFDAWDLVDPATVVFGPLQASPHNSAQAVDVDGDGDLDMSLHFRIKGSGLSCSTTSATLSGETFDGDEFEGTDSVVPQGC